MSDASTSQTSVTTADPETTPTSPDTPAVEPTRPVEPSAVERLFATQTWLPGPPEVSPDGAWLAYLLPNAEGTRDLWLTPLDGGEPKRIDLPFEPLEDADPDTGRATRGPQWSPDGAYIALTGQDEDATSTSIWLVPTAPLLAGVSTPVEPVAVDAVPETDAPADGEIPADPGAEPAMEAMAEADPVALEEPDTDVVPVAEEAHTPPQEPLKLLDHQFSDRSPRWSPDGTKIAFVHNATGRDVIALIDISDESDGIADILTWSDRNDREPVWSRDGKYLAFSRQIPGEREHADILIYIVETGEIKDLTGDKPPAMRHSLEWVPGRNLVAYVTLEGDWRSISVINADNKAGWVVTRESGDKTDFRFAPGEPRLAYVRSEGFATVVAERGLHASGAVAIDPGEGVARYPRWVADKRVVYGFSAPQKPFGFLVQESLANAERTPLTSPIQVPVVGTGLRHPLPFEFEAGPDEQFSGLVYRTIGDTGKRPGIVYMPDGPLTTRLGEFQIEEQALASTGLTVLTPVIHGATGFGQAVVNDLAELSDRELETSDLAEAGLALKRGEDVDPEKLAIVGDGFGGTLALLTAGARPGIYAAVVAIDPITDWRLEFAEADPVWRTWLAQTYGLPKIDTDTYALRTPSTFAAVIDVPVLLVLSDHASEGRRQQLAQLTAYLNESGVAWEQIDAEGLNRVQLLQRVSQRLAEGFSDEPSDEAPVAEPSPVADAVTPESAPESV